MRANFNSQYRAGEPVGPAMRDIEADAKRSRLRAAAGNWELEKAFEWALAADDERDRRRAMREVGMATEPFASEPEAA